MRATSRISRGGQISIPAAVRRRWGTTLISVEDQGDALVLRPIPADPLRAAKGSLAGGGPTAAELRSRFRREEVEAEERRRG